MAHAYTPGLRVTELTELVRERRLPLTGTVVVKVGDKVEAETVVARTELPGNVQTVNVANILGILPEDIDRYMVKGAGETIEKGEAIATSKSLFGLLKSHCRAPVTGSIETISSVTGQVIVREPPIPVEVNAYIDGEVVEVNEGEGAIIRTWGSFVQGIFGIGPETHGEIKMLVDSPEDFIGIDELDGNSEGKIAVAGSLVTSDVLQKAANLGVRAIVAGGIDAKDLLSFLGYDLGVAITGSEQKGITLVVTEGFGKMTMAHRTFDLLKDREGRKASVSGATQIRAGVIRPEVIVPLEDSERRDDEKAADKMSSGLQVGSPVRAIREPYFGKLGEVTELPPELTILESGAKVRVLKMKFGDGEEAVLPRANVEMIED